MSNETYWLEKRDADFVLRILAKYGNVSRAEMEREERVCPGDPIFEITVAARAWNSADESGSQVEYPTLQEALWAEVDER